MNTINTTDVHRLVVYDYCNTIVLIFIDDKSIRRCRKVYNVNDHKLTCYDSNYSKYHEILQFIL